MEPTQIIITLLNLAVFTTIIIQTSRKKAPPLWLFAIIGLSAGMCITDAILRQSIWPVLTAVVMTAVFVITLMTRMRWLEANDYKRRDEAADILRRQEENERRLREDLES